jgi:hypothetical protein
VVVAVELSRLLRRGLLVTGIVVGGWLLSATVAGTASADELPTDDTQTQKVGLLGGLLDGLTGTLGGVTTGVTDIAGSLLDTTGDILTPSVPPAADLPAPVGEMPSLLPVVDTGSASGTVSTDRADVARAETPSVTTPVAAPVEPVAPPAPPPVVAEPVPVAPPVVAVPAAPVPTPNANEGAADEHAGQGSPNPQPAKVPSAPVGPSSTVHSTHDSSGGARGTHGVLSSPTTLHPADAGFTTRSRAVNAAGRVAGLPASSPD